jgi:hypothetical protein
MKTKTGRPAKRAKRPAVTPKKSVRSRPVHKKLLLHPITAFVLLCVGVLVAGSTFTGWAESYDVTARVHAPLLTQAAVITNPTNGQRFNQKTVNIEGECPSDSYVKLYRGSAFGGVTLCDSGRFTIQTDLSTGQNDLKVRAFNLTDDEGPESPPVQAFYNLPEAPAQLPTSLRVSTVEEGSYRSGNVAEVSSRPTLTGLAPPFSDITVTFYSEPSVCKTKADAKGVWACTLGKELPDGIHHVEITAVTPEGETLTFPRFEISVVQHLPFRIDSEYAYQSHEENQAFSWELGISGGTPPYEFHIDWGDGSTERIVRHDRTAFTISHSYGSPVSLQKNYVVLVTATDAKKRQATFQLTAAVKGSIIPVSGGTNNITAMMDGIRRWIWVVWPVYIGVVLMAVSFWIGEREAYQRFLLRSKRAR